MGNSASSISEAGERQLSKYAPMLVNSSFPDMLQGMGKMCLAYALIMTLVKRRLYWINHVRCYECLSFAFSVASFRLLHRQLEKLQNSRLQNAVCGALAALTLTSLRPTMVSPLILSFLLAKTGESAIKNNFHPNPVSPLFAVLCNCAATAQIITMWFLRPQALDPRYLRFLDKQSNLSKPTLATIRAYRETPVRDMADLIVHQDGPLHSSGIPTFFLRYFALQIPSSLRMYAVVHALGLMKQLFQQKHSLGTILTHYGVNVFQSTLFLSAYCSFGMYGVILGNKLLPTQNISMAKLYLLPTLAGLAAIFEVPHRRILLATYISGYAIHSMYNLLPRSLKLSQTALNALFVLSCAGMLYYHDQQPRLITSWLLDMYSKKKQRTINKPVSLGIDELTEEQPTLASPSCMK